MPVLTCPRCNREFGDVDTSEAVALAYLKIHAGEHDAPVAAAAVPAPRNVPRFERPKISLRSSEETWIGFKTRWDMFKRGTTLSAEETAKHLFQCCDESLGNAVLKAFPSAATNTEQQLLQAIKQLAVVPVVLTVRRLEVLNCKQDHSETARDFFTRLKGKAATCSYTQVCASDACNHVNDMTDMMVKVVLIDGLSDEDIKRDVYGWGELDNKSLNDTVKYIEGKEMARNALSKPLPTHSNAALTAYKKSKTEVKTKTNIACKSCNVETERFVWNKRLRKTIEVEQCLPCWRAANVRKEKTKEKPKDPAKKDDETCALLIGALDNSHLTELEYQLDESQEDDIMLVELKLKKIENFLSVRF